jgi:hypothetical protein
MRQLKRFRSLALVVIVAVGTPHLAIAQTGAKNPFPGGENPDGSLKPTGRLTRLFTQDAYTEYALLAPGTDAFRIRFLPEETRVGATEIISATRGGSEGGEVEVYDPRTGKPLPFTYEAKGDNHQIRSRLAQPVPAGGIGRVLIYKTYKDPRTYRVYREANPAAGIQVDDISWVRSLSGYRLGVILPKGYAFLSSNIAAQVSTLPDGRVGLHFANPSGLSNPLTLHARKTGVEFTPSTYQDMFFDDIKTLYDLGDPAQHNLQVQQTFSDFRIGDKLPLDLLTYAPLQELKVTDLDTGKPLPTARDGNKTVVQLEVPVENDKQSAHLRVEGRLNDPEFKVVKGELVFDRTLRGLRNTILLPAGYQLSSLSQSGTIGMHQGRVFVALINLNSENSYRVVIKARKA